VVRAVARGARRLKSRFGAGLEPYTLLALSFYEKEGRELHSVRDAEILRSYFHLSRSAETMKALAYMGELVLEFAPPHEPNEKLFRMVNACLEALARSPADIAAITRYFEVWLLKLAGFLPNIRSCADCGKRLEGEKVVYLNVDSRARCRACSNGQGTPLSEEAHAQVEATQRLSPYDFAQSIRAAKSEASQAEVEQLMRRLIERILERELRTEH
jgi:DNA repair protein RecO (recombination protein O)